MVASGRTLAFEYRRALPIGQDTVLHSRDRDRIVANIVEREDAEAALYFVHGPDYCGKTSLTNTVVNQLNSKYPRKFINIELKIDQDLEQDSINYFIRQLIDQILQKMIDFEIITADSDLYLDWVQKVDGIGVTREVTTGLRSANIIAAARQTSNQNSNLTSAILDSDFKLLKDHVKSKRNDFRKFVLYLDDMDRFRESTLERKVMRLLLSCRNLDVLINGSNRYREYWELYYTDSDFLVLDYELPSVKRVDMFVIFFLELGRINAPAKFREDAAFHDIYETANREFKNFLIICNLIWQQISSGRTDRFEINAAVLSGLITIAKRESAPETIHLIESTIRVGEKSGLSRKDLLEVLAYKSLSIEDIARFKFLPNVPSKDLFQESIVKYARSFELLLDKGILFTETGIDGHRGFADSVVESYIRFHLRDERRKDKNGTKFFLADRPFPALALSVLRIEFFQKYLKPSSLQHEVLEIKREEEESTWSIFQDIAERDIFSIYEKNRDGDWSKATSKPGDQLVVLQSKISIRSRIFYLRVKMMLGMGEISGPLNEKFQEWQSENRNLLDFIGIEIQSSEFQILGLDETNDLRALIDSQDTSSGMTAFHEHQYLQSREEFIQKYRKIESLLAKYAVKFEEKKNESNKLLEKIADLKIRLAFTDLLVGHVSEALQTFFTINPDHLRDDISTWLYLDDVTNAFAFNGDWKRALEWSQKTVDFYRTNLGFIPVARGLTLLHYLPDGKFGKTKSETELNRYHYDNSEDTKSLIPELMNTYLRVKNGQIDPQELLLRIQKLVIESTSVPDIAPLRSALWMLNDTLGERGVECIADAVAKFRIPKDIASKLLYDDLIEIRGRK